MSSFSFTSIWRWEYVHVLHFHIFYACFFSMYYVCVFSVLMYHRKKIFVRWYADQPILQPWSEFIISNIKRFLDTEHYRYKECYNRCYRFINNFGTLLSSKTSRCPQVNSNRFNSSLGEISSLSRLSTFLSVTGIPVTRCIADNDLSWVSHWIGQSVCPNALSTL